MILSYLKSKSEMVNLICIPKDFFLCFVYLAVKKIGHFISPGFQPRWCSKYFFFFVWWWTIQLLKQSTLTQMFAHCFGSKKSMILSTSQRFALYFVRKSQGFCQFVFLQGANTDYSVTNKKVKFSYNVVVNAPFFVPQLPQTFDSLYHNTSCVI